MKKTLIALVISASSSQLAATGVGAGDLVYHPLNPSFGGNPNLSAHLISLAQIQNQFVDNNGGGGEGNAPPEIVFPPIVIDLGGLGDEPEAPTDAASASPPAPLAAGRVSN